MEKEKVYYSEELAREICETISNTRLGIRDLCKMNPNWPNANTIMEWKIRHPFFGELYARAKQSQAEILVDEILEIANNESRDLLSGANGELRANNAAIHRDRLKIDTIKWLAGKLAPRIYGDKIQVEKVDSSQDEDVLLAKKMASTIKAANDGRSSSSTD